VTTTVLGNCGVRTGSINSALPMSNDTSDDTDSGKSPPSDPESGRPSKSSETDCQKALLSALAGLVFVSLSSFTGDNLLVVGTTVPEKDQRRSSGGGAIARVRDEDEDEEEEEVGLDVMLWWLVLRAPSDLALGGGVGTALSEFLRFGPGPPLELLLLITTRSFGKPPASSLLASSCCAGAEG
jgi:hypothetical protein